jgi:uncharacterized protein involved in outer membrane biogenesis
MKKFLIGFAVFFLLLLVAVFTLPIIFKDKVVAQVKEAANESLTATVDFKDVDISIFRHFPKVSVGLHDIDVTGTGPFEGVKLVQAKSLDVAVDLWSAVFGDKVAIKGIYLLDPDLRVYVLEDGRANYDIVKPNAEEKAEADPSSGTIELEHYEIRNGKLLYDDRGLDMKMELEGLNHPGSG